MRNSHVSTTHQQGFSLLEVLVSIVLLSVGLLGLAGLQLSALQNTRDATLQSAAVRLGAELAELMRDNKDIAQQPTPANNPYLTVFTGTLPAAPQDCFASSCTDKLAVAQWGIRDWLTRVNATLPGPVVTVCYDSAPFDGNGLPRWACSNSGGVAMVKIGWTRRVTDSSRTGMDAFDQATRPSLVLPVTAGAGV
jgi:type IV pilus assembly protein PilV